MIALAWLFLLAATNSVELVDEVYQIPADDWRYVEVALQQQPALVEAEYRTEGGAGDVRVALLRGSDLERLRHEEAHGVLALTTVGSAGRLRFYVHDPGRYAVVVDNSGQNAARVRLHVKLDFGGVRGQPVTVLSPRRQMTVILVSFGVFFAIVSWSARRLMKAVKR